MNEKQIEWKETVFVFSQTTASNENIRMHPSGSWSLLFRFTCMWMFDGFARYNWTATFRVVGGRCVNVYAPNRMLCRNSKSYIHFIVCNIIFMAHVKSSRLLVRTCLIASITTPNQFVVFLSPNRSVRIRFRWTSKTNRFIIMRAQANCMGTIYLLI